MSESAKPPLNLHELTAQIVAAQVAQSPVAADALPGLIHSVFQALSTVESPTSSSGGSRPEPAVPVKRSVSPDHIICLEDGKSFKALRRHIQNEHNLNPDQYRERWGLPRDYPMVASNYAEHRSKLAKSLGLGRPRGSTAAAAAGEAPKKRGRKGEEAGTD